jgi:nitrogen fixation protein FixH
MREVTGPKVLAISLASFGLIITVNFFMAYKAISTFPGLEVDNSYVASQTFDADRTAQIALGWTVTPIYDPAAHLIHLDFRDKNGAAVTLRDLTVLIGRPTEAKDDLRPTFAQTRGVYSAPADLQQGKWMLQIEAHAADGTLFRQRSQLWVKG